jgi:acyl carrier protein
MDLEADLGVDSIKRVEILSTMREREPGLPDVDAGEMAKLRTLSEIVAYMGASGPVGASAAPAAAAPVAATKSAAPGRDLHKLMLQVVSEKTGYPEEMLGLEMDLEADLGVDSIKRVEILSTMREREPGLPDVDAGEMAKLRTLGEIVAYMGASGPVATSAAAAPVAVAVAAPKAAGRDLHQLMLQVVSEKTGYPTEMLGLEMDLEADLGVDSIKRVEILSTMREREPGLPDVDAGEMAKLRTLGEIVTYMGGSASATPAAVAAPVSAAAPKAAGRDLHQLMLQVVSEKTGYPTEMLGLEMDLEADLGVDSIKRVEILSTMREREPGLPDVDAGEMAKLRTLGEIVTYMGGSASATPAAVAAPVAAGGSEGGRARPSPADAAGGVGEDGLPHGDAGPRDGPRSGPRAWTPSSGWRS